MDSSEYKITGDDILAMMRYLRQVSPKDATPEKAIYLLGHYNIHFKKLEELYPELIEDLLKDFEEH